jgi:hypothetical protein
MSDFLEGCNDRGMKVSDFTEMFCKHCRNPECVRAEWATDRFGVRVATQEERMFNPIQADPRLPRYAQILASQFQDMLHRATVLELSAQRNDWEIPEIPILDGGTETAPLTLTKGVDSAVSVLAQARGTKRDVPEPTPEDAMAEAMKPVSRPEPPLVPMPKAKPTALPPRMNTEIPMGGIMLDGSPGRAAPVEDPWAIPVKKDVKVGLGAKVKMTGESKDPEK